MEASRSLGHRTLADAAFDRLVRRHRVHLERYVVHLGASREDAEEIAATALLRAYQSPPEIRCEREWRAWLSTVTRNLFFDARRRRQVRAVSGEGVLDALPSSAGSVDQLAAAAQEARQISAAIALLPPAQRA
jgi:RNA polymerase sigma factor (sigma-70 family)